MLIAETGPAAGRLRVREIDDDEGRRLARIVRRGSGPVVTWRRAQTVLLSAQGMDVAAIAKVAFTSEDRVRDVIRNFSADGFGSPYRSTAAAGAEVHAGPAAGDQEDRQVPPRRPWPAVLYAEPGQAGRLPGG